MPLVTEFAKNDRQRQMLKLILSRQEMARPYAAPPGIPDDRKAALRKAFDDSWADPELLAEMKARGQEVNPVSGAALDALIAELYATPKDVGGGNERARDIDVVSTIDRSYKRWRSRFDGEPSLARISSRAAFTALMMF